MMKLEKAIGIALRIGVALSVIFILVGMVLLFLDGGAAGYSLSQITQTNSPVNTSTFSFMQVISGLSQLDGISFILMGLIILIATPITRVALSIFGFFFERNWLYVAITTIVFIDLIIAIFVIPALVLH